MSRIWCSGAQIISNMLFSEPKLHALGKVNRVEDQPVELDFFFLVTSWNKSEVIV